MSEGDTTGDEPAEDAGTSRMGQAPSVRGADAIRAGVHERLFGDPRADASSVAAAARSEDAVPGGEKSPDGGGTAPRIANRDRIHHRVAAQLFGPSGGAASLPAWSEDTEMGGDGPRRPTDDAIEAVVGRFRVLEPLGHGGMGVVYRAYDPELDREVAIKVLRPDVHAGLSAKDAQSRLLREAQAMARLNHPNVIVVHEVGTVGDRVFVAMELVDGGTLRDLISRRPPWAEVLAIFRAAGAGLAAAHEAGLVHRDFKPDNVLLGRDGRVRVVDFGLARSLLDPTRDPAREPTGETTRPQRPEVDSLATPLTRTGAVLGTPAYMSPEQHLGHLADARSDQFSFCVALYEALYGERPFEGRDLITLSTNVVRGELRAPPPDVRIPGWIGTALRRGLSPRPSERFESMQQLLAELARDPRRKWRRIGLGLVVAAVASAGTYAAFGGDTAAGSCAAAGERMASVWNDAARAEVQRVLVASGEPYAERVAATTVDLLDRYAAEWVSSAEDACAAARVGGDGSDRIRAPKDRCLDARRAEVEQLIEALTSGAAGMAQQAVLAAADLSDLAACNDPRRLVAWDAPDDPATLDRVARARAQLAAAKARGATGAYDEAIAIASEVLEGLEGAALPAVEASALLVRGQYRERLGKPEDAESDLRLAVRRADVAGDFATKAQALTRLVFVISRDGDRYDEAMQLGAEARGVLDTLDAVPLLQAELDGVIGAAARNARQYEVALTHHERALKTRARLLGESHPDTASSLANIGSTLSTAHRLTEAEPYLRRALGSLEKVLGDEHPWVGTALGNLANCLGRQKRQSEALPLQQRSLAILEGALGPDHASVVRTTFNLGKLFTELGRFDEASALLEQGLARKIEQVGPHDATLGDWYTALGLNEEARGDTTKAREYHELGLDVRIRDGSPAYTLATYQFAIARTLIEDDPARAGALLDQARNGATIWAQRKAGADKTRGTNLRDEIDRFRAEHPVAAP